MLDFIDYMLLNSDLDCYIMPKSKIRSYDRISVGLKYLWKVLRVFLKYVQRVICHSGLSSFSGSLVTQTAPTTPADKTLHCTQDLALEK